MGVLRVMCALCVAAGHCTVAGGSVTCVRVSVHFRLVVAGSTHRLRRTNIYTVYIGLCVQFVVVLFNLLPWQMYKVNVLRPNK